MTTAYEELQACKAAVKKEHRIRWFVYAGERYNRQLIPHEASMRGQWDWEAKCSCGWESHFGGGLRNAVRRSVGDHYDNVAFDTMFAVPGWAKRLSAEASLEEVN